jgi:arsenate reductase
MLTFYHYPRCQTCVKARRYLTGKGYALRDIDITLAPPSKAQLQKFIAQSGRPYTDFLNRSGEKYRELNMKQRLKRMSEDDVVALLAREGRLIKRPIVTDGTQVTVGFKSEEFEKVWRRA